MSHFLIADGHFHGAAHEPALLATLVGQASARGMTELSILGDLFDIWLGLAGLDKPWHARLLAPLYDIKQAGVRLRYVVGNRDYFLKEWNERHQLFDTVVDGEERLDSPQGPLLLAHGDLVNRADRPYRRWRAFSRSTPLALVARILPRSTLERIAAKVAEKLGATNRFHKSYFPETELRARARELPTGALTLVFGHFHEHHDLIEGDKRIITLPFLGGENSGILVTPAGFERLATPLGPQGRHGMASA
jgi:UDP-2,3-diacylglucosamine hydrolase